MLFSALPAQDFHPWRTELGIKDPFRSELSFKKSKFKAKYCTKYFMDTMQSLHFCPSRALHFVQSNIRDHFSPFSLGDRSISTCRPSSADWHSEYLLSFFFPCKIQICFIFYFLPCSNLTWTLACTNEIKGRWAIVYANNRKRYSPREVTLSRKLVWMSLPGLTWNKTGLVPLD